MPERDERLYLIEMLGAIDRALRYTAEGRDAFLSDSRTQDAVIHGYFNVDLEIIWEIVETELPALRRQIAAIAQEG